MCIGEVQFINAAITNNPDPVLFFLFFFFSLVAGISVDEAEAAQLPDLTSKVENSGVLSEDDFQELLLLSDSISLKVKG